MGTYKNPAEITSQYSSLQQQNAKNYIKLLEAQFQDLTRLYGVNFDYFSRNLNFFNNEGEIIQPKADFTYFAGPETRDFTLKIPIKGIIDYGSDSLMFNNFGIDMTSNATLYITKKQFYFDVLQFAGLVDENISLPISFTLPLKTVNGQTFIEPFGKIIEVENSEDSNKSFNIKIESRDNILVEKNSETTLENFINYIAAVYRPTFKQFKDTFNYGNGITETKTYHPISTYYETNMFCEIVNADSMIGTIITTEETATISTEVIVNYNYYKTNNLDHYSMFNTEVDNKPMTLYYQPKVGDFIRMYFLDGSEQFRDYEISMVNDANFSNDKFSPFLSTYLWECSLVRRKPSSETIPENEQPQEHGLQTQEKNLEDLIMQDRTRENYVYDYKTEKELITLTKKNGDKERTNLIPLDQNKDEIYGGYGAETEPGVERDLDDIYNPQDTD